MNSDDFFETLKYEIYQSIPGLMNVSNKISKEVFNCFLDILALNFWIDNLMINKKTFKIDLENEEGVAFVNRLLFGLSYVQNPDNLETIKRLRLYILNEHNKLKIYNKVLPIDKKIFGLKYLEKKKCLFNKINELRDRLELFYEEVFIIADLVDQIEEIALQDESLKEKYCIFINNENVKYLTRLNLMCRYALTDKIDKLPEFSKRKGI